jgi:hypothetical protein
MNFFFRLKISVQSEFEILNGQVDIANKNELKLYFVKIPDKVIIKYDCGENPNRLLLSYF